MTFSNNASVEGGEPLAIGDASSEISHLNLFNAVARQRQSSFEEGFFRNEYWKLRGEKQQSQA